MAEAWKTRSGEAGEGQVPQAGDDLAAIRKKTSSKRGRASLEEEAARQAAAKKSRLEHRSTRTRALESIPLKPLLMTLAGLVVAAVFIILGLPALKKALNPPMSRDELQQISTQLQLQAEQRLGTRAGKPSVKTEPNRFLVTWRVPAGREKFAGGQTISSCLLTVSVSRENGKIAAIRQRGCRQ